jgi:hypothetical protein
MTSVGIVEPAAQSNSTKASQIAAAIDQKQSIPQIAFLVQIALLY